MKKRLLAFLLVLVMVASTLSACGETSENTETPESTQESTQKPVTAPLVIKLHYHRW